MTAFFLRLGNHYGKWLPFLLAMSIISAWGADSPDNDVLLGIDYGSEWMKFAIVSKRGGQVCFFTPTSRKRRIEHSEKAKTANRNKKQCLISREQHHAAKNGYDLCDAMMLTDLLLLEVGRYPHKHSKHKNERGFHTGCDRNKKRSKP
jgi:hypothetical protein